MADIANFNLELEEKSRFKTVQSVIKDKILKNNKASSTNKATDVWVNCFEKYLCEKGYNKLRDLADNDLPDKLMNFYTETCKQKTDDTGNFLDYKNSTLKCMRAGINRFLKKDRGIDIISDPRFIKANEMFKGVTRAGKQKGLGEVKSMPSIEEKDLQKINEYFKRAMAGVPNPRKLQQIVIFNVIYYMARRGRENLRTMSKNTFKVATDPDGCRYIYQQIKEQDKNHQENDMIPSNEARIYEIPGSSICPVDIFTLYMKCLHPAIDDLWQRPKKFVKEPQTPWYDAIPVGRDTLNNMMKTLSKDAQLSEEYTNHSIRHTVVSALNADEFEARHIMATTGHKSESSIRAYVNKCPTKKRKEMSESLANNLQGIKKKQRIDPVEKKLPDQQQEVKDYNQIDNIVLEEMGDVLNDSNLVKILESIEAENTQVAIPKINEEAPASSNTGSITVSNVQNVQKAPFFPGMYFPHSNVTINYNMSNPN